MSLEAFLYEYRITFPVGVDQAVGNGIPKTMSDYQLQGTSSLILIDNNVQLVNDYFGHISDLRLGAEIGGLIQASAHTATDNTTQHDGENKRMDTAKCTDTGYAI